MEVVASVCTCQAASGGWGHKVLHAAMLGWLASYRCTLLGLYTITAVSSLGLFIIP